VREAGDGIEALAVAEHWDAHVLVIDLIMPRRSAVEAMHYLRAHSRFSKTLILVITSNAVLMHIITPVGR
jgi:CheY-like chemotaxis protein